MKSINRHSPLFVWAYLFEDRDWVTETDSCTLFWRSTVVTPVKLAILAVCGALVSAAAVGLYDNLSGFLMGVGVVLGELALFVGATRGALSLHEADIEHKVCTRLRVTTRLNKEAP